MGTKIIEQGSTAGGIAKVQYLDESGNVLYEVNDSDKIFKMVNGKISGLAGTGNRMVTADSSGNLSASNSILEVGGDKSAVFTGNIGLREATPKAAIQIGRKANIFNGANTTNANWLDLGYNVYYNGGYKYTVGTGSVGDEASLLEIGNDMAFYTAVAGATDASVSLIKRFHASKDFVQIPLLAGTGNRMVVADSSGNLSATDRFKVNNIPTINTSGEINSVYMDVYDISFQWMNDTTLKIAMKGSDGVLRSVNLTLS